MQTLRPHPDPSISAFPQEPWMIDLHSEAGDHESLDYVAYLCSECLLDKYCPLSHSVAGKLSSTSKKCIGLWGVGVWGLRGAQVKCSLNCCPVSSGLFTRVVLPWLLSARVFVLSSRAQTCFKMFLFIKGLKVVMTRFSCPASCHIGSYNLFP